MNLPGHFSNFIQFLPTSSNYAMRVSLRQKALSYLQPVVLWKGSSPVSPVLELLLYQGRYQLATVDALYSDGDRYRPLVTGFGALRGRLEDVQSVLVLGGGIGSAVDVLRRFGARPHITLVELDKVVAQWAGELLREEDKSRVRIVVEDAHSFIQKVQTHFDVVVVDVFTSRKAAPFVTTKNFLEACKVRITPRGIFLLNYMQNADASTPWEETFARIGSVFPGARTLAFGPNRVVVWEAPGTIFHTAAP